MRSRQNHSELAQRQRLSSIFYNAFLAPQQQVRDLRNRETVFNILLLGTIVVVVFVIALLAVSYFALHNSYVADRLVLSVGVLVYVGLIYWLGHVKKIYRLAAFLLTGTYAALATICTWAWGINVPFAMLLFALEIVIAGILLGPRSALYGAIAASLTLFFIQSLITCGAHHPAASTALRSSGFGDVIGYSVAFGILALVSWLFGRQTELSLIQADKAQAALLREKSLLKTRVEQRTMELRAAQLEEMRNLYQFAEIGHLSTALLHDLANHLTTLTLDIEDLHSKQRSETIKRARMSIRHLDDMVQKVRDQIQGKTTVQSFNPNEKISETIKLLTHKARESQVKIDWQPVSIPDLEHIGDPVKFNQIIAVLVSNAIDAYKDVDTTNKKVKVALSDTKKAIEIRVSDWGPGITPKKQETLFQPFNSTKHTGMGIGLVIIKQIIETHFKGSIALNKKAKHTEFVVTLPVHDQ